MISPSPSNVSDSSADPTENNGNSSALSFKTKVGFVLGFAVGFVFMQAMVFLGVRSGFRDLGLEGDPSTTQAKQQRLGGAGQQHRLEELDSGTISGSGSIHDAVNHTTTTNSSPSLHEGTTKTTTEEGRSFHVKASLKRDKEEESTPSQLQPTAPSDTDTIFQLPFYIYDNELDWSVNNSLGDNTGYYGYKHSDDYWLLQSAKKHPMRTYNPKEAELFFVPILLTAWNAYGYKGNDHPNKFCVNGRCNVDLLLYSDQLLGRSKWFRRSQGRDHILVDTHWRKVHWKELKQSPTQHLLHCNTVSFERRHVSPEVLPGFVTPTGGRAHVPTMYVGRPCQNFANKTHDFAMIANMQPQNPNFHDRSRICKYLGESSPYLGGDDVKYSVAHCGKGGQCPALGRARFGFHARGDTWGSNRLMDTFLSGAIPLVTNREQYKILPDFVPWADVTYLVDVSQSSRFHKSMKRVLEAPEEEYLEKKANITKFMDVFDHKQGRQFDLYMHKFAQLLELYE